MPTTMRSDVTLTDEQQSAVEAIINTDNRVRTLGGYAGTGKTTIIAKLLDRLPGYAVCAYTGKAADVLRRKGMKASTIHSLIYFPVKDSWGNMTFELVPPEIFVPSGIIIDEASMVGERIYEDLLTFDVPLIFVGDHGQLEPVGDSGFNLMESPDVTLETVHRNAGPISLFAEQLRLGRNAVDALQAVKSADSAGAGEVLVETFDTVRALDINREWQLICAYNRTRCDLNVMVRDHIGMPSGIPAVGDRVICLQNNRTYGLFNGMQGTIGDIDRDKRTLVFVSSAGTQVRVPYNPQTFGSSTKPAWSSEVVPFDWAYCVTCHKAQGDEFDNVCVIEQRCAGWEHSRWAYTAASRAKGKLVWVV